MEKVIVLVMMLFVAGCGDTVNQAAQPVQNKLVVTSSKFWIYSSQYPSVAVNGVVTQYASSYFAQGNIGYEGDPQGVILTMAGNKSTYYPQLTVISGKLLLLNMSVLPTDIKDFITNNQVVSCILTDPHGNDSDIFPMFLRP